MIRRPPRSTQSRSSAASDVYKRQVHAGQPRFAVSPTGEDRLIADGDAMFIDAHLGTPHPERSAEQNGVRLPHLIDFDVGRLESRLAVDPVWHDCQELGLVRLAVAVFCQHRMAVQCHWSKSRKRITHVVSPMGTSIGISLFWCPCSIEELDGTQFLRKGSIASLRPSPRKL